MRRLLAMLLSLACVCSHGEELLVPRFNQREPWAEYIIEVLEQALARAPDSTADQWHWVDNRMNQDRAFALLRNGHGLDIYWSMTSAAREQGVLPVRIPLMKGLLGSRLLIIRKESLPKFRSINSFEQLRQQISIGQGLDWPDTAIKTAAGLHVVTSSSYETLFRMLKAGRFDGIALGANEIEDELAKQHDDALMIEPGLAIAYPAPVFFFVTPRKPALAQRIERGLQRMLADGSFNALFEKRWSKALLNNNLKHRRVFQLPNPTLSPQTADMIQQHPEYFFFPPLRQ